MPRDAYMSHIQVRTPKARVVRFADPPPDREGTRDVNPKAALRPGADRNNGKAMRRLVWNRYVGERKGYTLCACCNSTRITAFNFESGTVGPPSAEGGADTLDNLRPICALCARRRRDVRENAIEFHSLRASSVEQTWWGWWRAFGAWAMSWWLALDV